MDAARWAAGNVHATEFIIFITGYAGSIYHTADTIAVFLTVEHELHGEMIAAVCAGDGTGVRRLETCWILRCQKGTSMRGRFASCTYF